MKNIDRDIIRFVFVCFKDEHYDYEDEIYSLGGKIVKIVDNRVKNPARFVSDLKAVFVDERVDIVHAHTDMSNVYAMIAAKRARVPVRISHSHNTKFGAGSTMNNLFNMAAKRGINRCCTERLACGVDAGNAMYGRKRHFTTINNGIDIAKFQYSARDRAKARGLLALDGLCEVFLHVGSFKKAKNHGFVLEIFGEYNTLHPNSRLLLVGDGELLGKTKAKATQMGLQDKIMFAGKISDIAPMYSAADMLLLPSLFEGLPLTLIEAQANGLSCLASTIIDKCADFGGVGFLSLCEPAREWAATAADLVRTKRRGVSEQLKKDYDIRRIAGQMQSLYMSRCGASK